MHHVSINECSEHWLSRRQISERLNEFKYNSVVIWSLKPQRVAASAKRIWESLFAGSQRADSCACKPSGLIHLARFWRPAHERAHQWTHSFVHPSLPKTRAIAEYADSYAMWHIGCAYGLLLLLVKQAAFACCY